jgi:hypothetical protein
VLRDEMSGADDAIAAQSRSLQITIEGTTITTKTQCFPIFLMSFMIIVTLIGHQLDAPFPVSLQAV